jgi:integrase
VNLEAKQAWMRGRQSSPQCPATGPTEDGKVTAFGPNCGAVKPERTISANDVFVEPESSFPMRAAATLARVSIGGSVPRRRYQMPSVHIEGSKNRSYYYVRYWADVLTKDKTVKRRRLQHFLGYVGTTNNAAERARRGEMTKREAEQARNKFFESVNRSSSTIQSQVPVREFIGVWQREHVSELGAGTQAKYRNYVDNYLLPSFGEFRLCDLTTEMLQTWLNRLQLSWASKSDVRNILSSIYSKAADWGYWHEKNPAQGVSPGKKRATRQKQLLTNRDSAKLLESLPEYIYLILRVCQVTGCRISEVLGLKWGDIENDWITVRRRWYRGDLDVVKTEKANRELPIGALSDQLEPLRKERDDFVFDKGTGEPHDDRDLLKVIRATAKELGIYFAGMGFHSFRRAAITALQAAGGSTAEAQLYAGHSRPDQTGEYTLLQRERLRKLVDQVEEGRRAEVLPVKPAAKESA